ncbi:hypothetical protein N7453_010255 [Penicillium expansum]|nr:hypothetical protein N7453_010255 [Penicillium expansum]
MTRTLSTLGRHDLQRNTKALDVAHRTPRRVPKSAIIEVYPKECHDLGKCEYFGLTDQFVVIFCEAEEI